jgi:hypothetical protein
MVILAGALRGVYPAQADPWEAAAYGPAGGGNSRPLFFWSNAVLSLRSGRAWWPSRSSKPVSRRSPSVGRFDSCAAPLHANPLHQAGFCVSRSASFVGWKRLRPLENWRSLARKRRARCPALSLLRGAVPEVLAERLIDFPDDRACLEILYPLSESIVAAVDGHHAVVPLSPSSNAARRPFVMTRTMWEHRALVTSGTGGV